MIVNKNRFSRIFLLPLFLGISFTHFSQPVKAMDKIRSLSQDPEFLSTAMMAAPFVCTFTCPQAVPFLPLAQGAFEMSSSAMQNYKYGSGDAFSISPTLEELVYKHIPQGSYIPLKNYKLDKDFYYARDEENGTLYLDEVKLLEKTSKEQEALIKEAIAYYKEKYPQFTKGTRFRKLIGEIMGELNFPENTKISVQKMNTSSVCMIAQEYQFLGVHPTNGTLYLDEEYLNMLPEKEQRILIKSALLHYKNSTYTTLTTSKFLTAAVCGYLSTKSYQWGTGAITSIIKNAFDTDLNDRPESFLSPTGWLKSMTSIFIGLGVSAATNHFLNKMITKPVHSKLLKDCHESVQNSTNENKPAFEDEERNFLKESRKVCDPNKVCETKVYNDIALKIDTVDPREAFGLVLTLGGEIEKYRKINPQLVQQIHQLIDNVLVPKYNKAVQKN